VYENLSPGRAKRKNAHETPGATRHFFGRAVARVFLSVGSSGKVLRPCRLCAPAHGAIAGPSPFPLIERPRFERPTDLPGEGVKPGGAGGGSGGEGGKNVAARRDAGIGRLDLNQVMREKDSAFFTFKGWDIMGQGTEHQTGLRRIRGLCVSIPELRITRFYAAFAGSRFLGRIGRGTHAPSLPRRT